MGKTIGVTLSLRDRCTPQLKNIVHMLGATEKEAGKLSRSFRNTAKIAANDFKQAVSIASAGIGVFAAFTYKVVEAGDKIDKMSQKIGMSRKAYQEWDYVMSQNGSSVESLQMGYKTLATQMSKVQTGSKDTRAMFNKLGVSVTDVSGKLRTQEDVFKDTVKSLQQIQNPTEKAIMAQKLFGKSAIELKPLLNQSAEATDGLIDKANKLGMVLDDKIIDDSVKFKDTVDTIKKAMGGLMMTIGAGLLPHLQELSDQFINNLPQIKNALLPVLTTLFDVVGSLIDNFEGVIAILQPFFGVFVGFKAVQASIFVIKALVGAIDLLTVAVNISKVAFMAHPFYAWGTVAIGVVSGIVLITKNWDNLVAKVKAAGKLFRDVLGVFHKKDTGNSPENVKHNALDTSNFSGGTTLVGEYGPELVNLPRGTSILSNNNTKQALSGGTNITVNLNVQGNMVGNREFVNEMLTVMGMELRKVIPA